MKLNELIDAGWVEIAAYTPHSGGVQRIAIDSKSVYWIAKEAKTEEEFFRMVYDSCNRQDLCEDPREVQCR